MPILKAFQPQAVCLQLGADAHYLDPLARVCLTAQGWLEAVKDIKSLCVPIIAVGGGGYNQTTVPRMWALATAVLFDIELPDATPGSYFARDTIRTLTDHEPPPVAPHDADHAREFAEQTVTEIKNTLFERFGLPYGD